MCRGWENRRPQATKHTATTEQPCVRTFGVFGGSHGAVFTTLPCLRFMRPTLILLKSSPLAASRVGLHDCLEAEDSVPAKSLMETKV